LAVPWYGQIAPRVTPHQQVRGDFSTISILKRVYFTFNNSRDFIIFIKAVNDNGAVIKEILILFNKVYLKHFY
jgi:hypothetical protein